MAEDVSQHPSSPGSVTDLLDPLRTNAEALRLRAKELAELEAAAIEQAENATKAAKAARSTIVRKRLLASEEEHRKLAEEATAQRMKADLLATKAQDELAEAELKAKEAAAAAEAKAAKEAAEAAALAEAAAVKDREDAQKVAAECVDHEGECAKYIADWRQFWNDYIDFRDPVPLQHLIDGLDKAGLVRH